MDKLFRRLPQKARRLFVYMEDHGMQPEVCVEQDGGPGSGNWGHKGRPGKRGGSGKGGGKIMRTGNAASGFSSIKRDPAFAAVKEAAKAYNANAFWNLIQNDDKANAALRQQHKDCGTQESYADYQKRIYDMLHKASAQELAYKDKEGKRIAEQAAEAEARRHKTVTVPRNALDTYRRRPQQYKHEITDVLNQFGLDGKPRMMSRDEFDQYRKDHPNDPLFFRTYRGQDEAQLKEYDKMLNEGEWYVDCSNGGAQYGQGMYCVGVYDRTKDYWPGVRNEMWHYSGSLYGSGSRKASTRVMMLDPSAKIFRPAGRPNAYWGMSQIRSALLEELSHRSDIDFGKDIYTKSDEYVKSQEFKDFNVKEVQRMMSGFDHCWALAKQQEATGGNPKDALKPFQLASLHTQMKKLANMQPAQRSKMLYDFLNDVNEVRAKEVAFANAGKNPPTWNGWRNGGWVRETSWTDLQERESRGKISVRIADAVRTAAEKHAPTKQMAALLAKMYYNDKGPYDATHRSEISFDRIINPDSRSRATYENMNAGALAALMGYDAIDAHGHGQTGSYTVILNRTKLILSDERVNLHGQWKG